jgi:hypothetical protein
MERGILAVQTEALPGQEAAFNAWYDDVHVPEILTVPGFASCRRFRATTSPLAPRRAEAWATYLAVYEIAGRDVVGAHTELLERVRAGRLTLSGSVAPDPYRSQLFEQIAEHR